MTKFIENKGDTQYRTKLIQKLSLIAMLLQLGSAYMI